MPNIGKITVNKGGNVQIADQIYNNAAAKQTTSTIDHKILYLSACPKGEQDLRFTSELSAIKKAIDRVKNYKVQLEFALEVQVDEIIQKINSCNPDILHVSVHGDLEQGLLFVDDAKEELPLSVEEFKEIIIDFISLSKSKMKLVVLSACNSVDYAASLEDKIDAIGMNGFIPIDAANIFAEKFYSLILEDTSINEMIILATNRARSNIKKANFSPQSGIEVHEMPKLFRK